MTADITAANEPAAGVGHAVLRVNNGSFLAVPMAFVSGRHLHGRHPRPASPAKVEYYVSATDSAAQTNTFPKTAPSELLRFVVGVVNVFYFEDFESGTHGWTHGQTATQDDWQLSSQVGAPNGSFGQSGDPTSAASGTNIWGNDLGPPGWNGAYANNVSNYLRSPAIDLSGAVGATLRFQRWLAVEQGQYDHARVKVNGIEVWSNPVGTNLIDTSWVPVEVDISFADGDPAAQIEFSLDSDVSVTFGGWNLDDVTVESLTGSTPPPNNYCTSKFTSSGSLPSIGSTGTPAVSVNNFVLELNNAEPNKSAIMFWGTQPHAGAFKGGTLCVKPPVKRTPLTSTNGAGFASKAFPLNAGMIGQDLYFQWWFRDPPDFYTVGLSDGLHATIGN